MHLCIIMKKGALIILLSLVSFALMAQETDWYVNFHHIMDNREYERSVGLPQSFMGARLDFAGGLKADSTSGIYFGLNYMYEYGGDLDSLTPALNLYYELNRENFAFYAGEFNREKVLDLPLFMFGDSLKYYTPNIGGMAFEFRRRWGKQNIFVDWTGRRSKTRRESFVLGFSGLYKKNTFYIENYGYMYHNALTYNNDPNETIRDNGIGALFIGADISDISFLDVLKYDIGAIANYDRWRPADYGFYGGVMGRLNAHYKRFGLDLTSYWGSELHVPLGDQLYKNGNYTRLDLCAIPIIGQRVESVFKWSFHLTGGEVSTSQQFFLTARF